MLGAVTKPKLGELLLEAKVLTPDQLDLALNLPRAPGQKLGHVLVERGLVSEPLLTQVLSKQLSVPWVSLHHVEFSRPLLDLVPGELADRFGLVPILVRSRRGEGDTLIVAMEDPLVDGAVEAIQEVTGLRVKPMIASRTDVRAAIRIYYGIGEPAPAVLGSPSAIPPSSEARPFPEGPQEVGLDELGAILEPTPPPGPTFTEAESPLPPVAISFDSMVPDEVHSFRGDDDDVEPAPAVSEASPVTVPADVLVLSGPEAKGSDPALGGPRAVQAGVVAGGEARKKRGRRVTLLDGTTVFVPERAGAESTAGRERTALELVATLRALSSGKSAEAGHVDWEPLVGALLSVLLRKRLVADWELVEELRKFAPKSDK
jgi:type IV pilus assembly protein PilB